jgi:predicted GNAT superfamily acetyltransferase
MTPGVRPTIRSLRTPAELGVVDDVLREVWGTATPLVALELLVAIAHCGGYVAVADHDGRPVGASVGRRASSSTVTRGPTADPHARGTGVQRSTVT